MGSANLFFSLVLMTPMTLNSLSTVAFEIESERRTDTRWVISGKSKALPFFSDAIKAQNSGKGVEALTVSVVWRSRWYSASTAETSMPRFPRVWNWVATSPRTCASVFPRMLRASKVVVFSGFREVELGSAVPSRIKSLQVAFWLQPIPQNWKLSRFRAQICS